jgi:hypothetical protein
VLANTGPFTNLQSDDYYWSGLEYARVAGGAWYFHAEFGYQSAIDQDTGRYAVAVRPGDVASAVPEPKTFGLTLMRLGTLLLAKKRAGRLTLGNS